ncbi:hypothetical protein, partial [Salmonella sp. s58408]|uniref:hypothetical protein n=1 Tax=Salmonella sp. s58408 TaxID=3159701 RepID=UPI003980B532
MDPRNTHPLEDLKKKKKRMPDSSEAIFFLLLGTFSLYFRGSGGRLTNKFVKKIFSGECFRSHTPGISGTSQKKYANKPSVFCFTAC